MPGWSRKRGPTPPWRLPTEDTCIERFNDHAGEGASAHVTVIRGGEKTNIIPDEARASVDVRVACKSDVAPVEAFFQSLPAHTHVPGVTLTVSGDVSRPPMEADDRTLGRCGG